MREFRAPGMVGPLPVPGRVIERVECHGKTLEVQWDDGITLRTHMRLAGSWHLYRKGERWRKPNDQLRVAIEAAQWIAVCFSTPSVEIFRQFDRNRHPGSGGLGPNICEKNADLSECSRRLIGYHNQDAPLADVLADERVISGVGNVFRSEVLWITEVDPWVAVSDIQASDATQLVNAAHRVLRDRVGSSGNAVTAEAHGSLNIYGRNGQRCPRCGDTITVSRTGQLHRLLYWCRGCQVLPATPDATGFVQFEPEGATHPVEAACLADLPWRRGVDIGAVGDTSFGA